MRRGRCPAGPAAGFRGHGRAGLMGVAQRLTRVVAGDDESQPGITHARVHADGAAKPVTGSGEVGRIAQQTQCIDSSIEVVTRGAHR